MRLGCHFYTRPVIFTIIFALLFSPYCLPTPRAFALSTEEETIMGQEFLVQIQGRFHLLDDNFANQYINELGHYLIRPLETKHFPFQFYIIETNMLNAFAAPGGHIFIFSGLIEALDNIDELAAIICHEIGHVAARHLSQRIEQNKMIGLATLAGVLAGILIGGSASGPLITGSLAAAQQAQLSYSRTDERQADQLGFKYMKAAGYNPAGMIGALDKLAKGQWLGSNKIPAYLLTHPTGPERMSNLESLMSGYEPGEAKNKATFFRELFPVFKTVVTAKCMEPDEAKRIFDREIKELPESFLPHFGLGLVYLCDSDYAPAIEQLNKSLEKNPEFVPALIHLGEAYQMSGQDRKAISVLEQALNLDEGNRRVTYLLGLSNEQLGRYDTAIALFKRLAAFGKTRNEVYYRLGICYGNKNQLALAHYNFGLYFKNLRQIQKARFHFHKAEGLSSGNVRLKKKIREGIKDF